MLIKTSFQLTKPHQCTLKREILSFFHTFLFMVAMLIGAYLFVSLKTSMTGFYIFLNFEYRSNRMRRMCLIQLASAEDKAKTSQHRSERTKQMEQILRAKVKIFFKSENSKNAFNKKMWAYRD